MTEKDLGTLIETGLKDLGNRIEQLHVEVRQTQVQIESVRGDIKQLAEGIANVDQKLDRLINENIRQFDEVRALLRSRTFRSSSASARLRIVMTV